MSNEMQGAQMMENREDYGLSVENPVEVKGIDAEYFYLDNLGFADGSPIFYVRAGSWSGPKPKPVDKFQIYCSEEEIGSGEPVATIYIYGYGNSCSTATPKGFIFRSDEYINAVTRPDLFIPDMM